MPGMTRGHHAGTIKATKLDSARRQLETAITLWFNDSDPVSIHTLTAASYEILRDLNKKARGSPMGRDSDSIKPEFSGQWRKLHSDAENFFKHADKDPHDTFNLAPQSTDIMLLDAVAKYEELSQEKHHLMSMFTLYMALKLPMIFVSSFIDEMRQSIPVNEVAPLSRKEFYKRFIR